MKLTPQQEIDELSAQLAANHEKMITARNAAKELSDLNLKQRNEIERKKRAIARAEEDSVIETSKAKLAREFNIPRNAKFDKAWNIAWDERHSESLESVEDYFCQLAELLTP